MWLERCVPAAVAFASLPRRRRTGHFAAPVPSAVPQDPAQNPENAGSPARGEPPLAVMARWPRGERLSALISGGGEAARARWSILARPGRTVVAEGAWTPDGVSEAGHAGAAGGLPFAGGSFAGGSFAGGWIGCLAYDAGRDIEPAVERGGSDRSARADRAWPRAVWMRCEDAWVHDAATGDWSRVGDPPWLEATPRMSDFRAVLDEEGLSSASRARYERAVSRALEYIRAGDVYQVNLTHRLSARFAGDARAFALRMLGGAGAWYGAYLEWGEGDGARALVSASPELLMAVEPVAVAAGDGSARQSSWIWTRPMKGTRAAGPGAADELHANIKENAELNMIVDLLRNDLGRVCELGSVRVSTPREIEAHHGGQLLQATATVEGVLAAGGDGAVDVWAALRAMFPGGSVTGAPKIRAMQIIDELEESRRGPYCGAIGYVSDFGHASFNIAIRTAAISGRSAAGVPGAFDDAVMDYGAGAGIVADSVPRAEWEETLQKARVFLDAVGGGGGGEHGGGAPDAAHAAEIIEPSSLGHIRGNAGRTL